MANIISFLNPISDNFFGLKLIELFSDLLKKLFIPSEERITALSDVVSSKFSFVTSIKESIESVQNIISNLGTAPKLTINVGPTKYTAEQEITVLDLSFYQPFKSLGDLMITGFCYLSFIWRMLLYLPSIISGASVGVSNISSFVEKNDVGGSKR